MNITVKTLSGKSKHKSMHCAVTFSYAALTPLYIFSLATAIFRICYSYHLHPITVSILKFAYISKE